MNAPGAGRPKAAQWWVWLGSIVGAGVLLALASRKIELWPDHVEIVAPDLLILGIALYVPYVLARAVRLRWVLDPLLRRHGERIDGPLLYGSGLVSFFLVLLLPFRLGEFSRPLLLSRAERPGLGFTEALGAAAVERVVDGLVVVGLLFAGLALSSPATENLEVVRQFGRWMAVVFGVAAVALMVAAAAPDRFESWLTRLLPGALGGRVGEIAVRVARTLAPLWKLRWGLPFLACSVVYWGITVAQEWLILQACGLDLGLAEASAVVAIVGLSIQLPGGPAQAGSFQVGSVAALALFVDASTVEGAGSSFTAVMYALQLAGAAIVALPGAALLALSRRAGPSGG